jgi:hypothetical protein
MIQKKAVKKRAVETSGPYVTRNDGKHTDPPLTTAQKSTMLRPFPEAAFPLNGARTFSAPDTPDSAAHPAEPSACPGAS